MVWIAPSLTTYGNPSPAYRIYEIDSDTNVITNIYQYWLNLTEANQKSQTEVSYDLGYNMTAEYNLPDLSRASVNSLVLAMKADNETFRKF